MRRAFNKRSSVMGSLLLAAIVMVQQNMGQAPVSNMSVSGPGLSFNGLLKDQREKLSPQQRRETSIHEAGHTIVMLKLARELNVTLNHATVHDYVTDDKRGLVGYDLPEQMEEANYIANVSACYGGTAADQVILNKPYRLRSFDMGRAASNARSAAELQGLYGSANQIQAIMDEAHQRAKNIIAEHKHEVLLLAAELNKRGTMDQAGIYETLRGTRLMAELEKRDTDPSRNKACSHRKPFAGAGL